MTNAKKVNMALAYKGMSKAALAQAIGISNQNLCQKLLRDSLSLDELVKIAQALGGKYVFGFEFPDGMKI